MAKQTLTIPKNELISDIKMGTKDFAEEVKEKSGIDEEKEELLGVDNIFKVVDLERELKIRDLRLEEKEKELEKERKLRKEREKEIKLFNII